jgi:hypothetical protein
VALEGNCAVIAALITLRDGLRSRTFLGTQCVIRQGQVVLLVRNVLVHPQSVSSWPMVNSHARDARGNENGHRVAQPQADDFPILVESRDSMAWNLGFFCC